jgi:hypothetical protein
MPRSFQHPDTQISNTDLYLDNLTMGSSLESGAATLQDDLNAARTVLKHLSGLTKWYTDRGSVRSINTLDTDLSAIEDKPLLFRAQVLTDVTVTALQNWEVLVVADSETPTVQAAVGVVTTSGAVVAAAATDFATVHSLNEVAGVSALSPQNLCLVRDAATLDSITSGGREVFALLQSESATNPHTIDDDAHRVKLSFVRANSAGDDLEACPVADIAGKSINYSYVRRIDFLACPQTAFLAGAFIDQVASVDVTLNNAIDNQTGPATQVQSIEWRISDTYTLNFTTSDGARTLLGLGPAAGGDVVQLNLDTLDINNTASVDLLNGAVFDSGGTAISVGVTAGEVSSAGKLDLISGSTFDINLLAADELTFSDGYKAGSGFGTTLTLADSSTEWDNFETAFGEVSLLNAIVQASNTSQRAYYAATVTEDIPANTNVTGEGSSPNIDVQIGDYSALTDAQFVTHVAVYVEGQRQRGGADAAANHDVYPGTSKAHGDLKFEYDLKTGDNIIVELYTL